MSSRSGFCTAEYAGPKRHWVHTSSGGLWSKPGMCCSLGILLWAGTALGSALSTLRNHKSCFLGIYPFMTNILTLFSGSLLQLQTIILISFSINCLIESLPFPSGSVRAAICLLCSPLHPQYSGQSLAYSGYANICSKNHLLLQTSWMSGQSTS